MLAAKTPLACKIDVQGGRVALKFELVIFDCDGVLVDSESITNRVFSGMLNELGIFVSAEDIFERFVGRSMPQCLEVMEVLSGRPVPAAACAVIEDTPTGVRAGVAAEMTVFGYCAVTPQKRLLEAGAHYTFGRMRELPALLGASAR